MAASNDAEQSVLVQNGAGLKMFVCSMLKDLGRNSD